MDTQKILTDSQNLYKILLYMHSQQTADEQYSQQTVERNSVGFNGLDASFLSSLAEQVKAGKQLSDKQMYYARIRLAKYKRQLETGEWMHVVVPELTANTTSRMVSSTSQLEGNLYLDEQGRMVFKPFVYPSKQITSLGGFQWEPSLKSWRQYRPVVTKQLVSQIQEMFHHKVTIDPKIVEEINPPPVVLPAEISEHQILFPFQKESIEFCLQSRRGMLALAPGLGKTACAIFAAKAAGAQHILVISPLSLVYNWRKEIEKWIGSGAAIVHSKQLLLPDFQWTITNYDTVRLRREEFSQQKWDCIIVDESICIKNRKALRTKAVQKLVTDCNPKYVWLLSGSPTSRLLDDMWSQLHTVSPNRFSSYWRFTEKYCYVEQDQWGWHILSNRPDAIQTMQKDLEDIYFCRTQDQVLDLPEWILEDRYIQMDPEQDKLYASMEEAFVAHLADGESLLAPNVLSQMTRLVQLSSNPALVGGKNVSPKMDAVVEMLEYEQGPFIVWTSFIETANLLEQRLSGKYKVAVLNGSVSELDRQQIVDAFQAGEIDVLIAHPAVGKFGFTLTAARTSIYLERNYNADDYYQSLHRVRRIGTTSSPHIIHLISERANGNVGMGTIDGVIAKILAGRRDNSIALTQGELKSYFSKEAA